MSKLVNYLFLDLSSSNKMIKYSLISFLLLNIILVFNGYFYNCYIISDIYGLAICFSIITMIFTKLNQKRSSYYGDFGIGFIYIGILLFIHATLVFKNSNICENIIVDFFIIYFKFIVIYLSEVFSFKKLNKINIHFIYFIIFWILLIVLYSIESFYNMKSYSVFILFIISVTLFAILDVVKINNSKLNIDEKSKARLKIFIFLTNIGFIMEGLGVIYSNLYLILVNPILQCISYLVLYLYIEDNVLNIYYKYTEDIIIEKQNLLKESNRMILLNNRGLEESRMLFEKSNRLYLEIVNSINKGIFLFLDDKILVINNEGKQYLKAINFEEVDNQLEYILWNITDEFFTDDELDFGFMKDFIINNKGESISIRVYLLRIDKNSKFILVSNTSELLEYRHLNDYLQSYLSIERSRDDFYSNISHELRTPINVISSALQLNDTYLQTKNFEGIKKYNTIIRKNCLRLIRTINNFIDADKLEGGYFEMNRNKHNIIYIIDEVIDASIKYFNITNTKIIFDPEEEEVFANIDKSQLQRILLNIFSNTLKYGKKQGGKVQVKTKRKNKYIEISINNDAQPIPEDKRRVIFDKFTKIDSSIARPSEGSGLGLFLTKKLVEENGGSIELTSSDSGNTFRITFPVILYNSVNIEENPSDFLIDLEEKVDIEFADIYF